MNRRALVLILVGLALRASGGEAGSLIQNAPANAKAKTNPFAGWPEASRAGARLFARECGGCHGQSGEGIGKAPSLRSRDVAEASAGALFWVLRNGALPRGMPSFAHLPEPERWQIVT